jgi:short-subunit dehydrogenase
MHVTAMARFQPPAPGSVAIVTGASSGLGRAMARDLARRGHVVLAVARRGERLTELARAHDADARAGGGRIEALALDVTAPDAADRVHDEARRLGEIGWLVNNAGSSTFGRLEASRVEEQRALVRLNCEALVTLTTRVLPELVRAGRGIVLQVASAAGLQPTPGWAVYGATKAFVISLAEAMSEELRGSGVSVTALCPGPMATEFFKSGTLEGFANPPAVDSGGGPASAPRDNVGEAPAVAASRRRPFWELTPEVCAEAGLRAALAGRTVAVIGRTNRAVALSGRFAPRALLRFIAAKISLRYVGLPPMPPRRPAP